MPVLKAASEHGSFDVVPAGTFFTMAELNSGIDRRYFDQRYVRGALLAQQGTSSTQYWGLNLSAARNDLWLHGEFSFNGNGINGTTALNQEIMQITGPPNGTFPSGVPVAQISGVPGLKQIRLSYRDGVGLTHVHGPVTIVNDRCYTYDIYVNIATQTLRFFIDGTQVFSQVGGITYAASSVSGARVTGRGYNGWFSQIILADESTVGWKVAIVNNGPMFPFNAFSFPNFSEWIAYNGATSFALQNYVSDTQYNESTFVTAQITGQKTNLQTLDAVVIPSGAPTFCVALVQYGVAKNAPTSAPNGWSWYLYRAGSVYPLGNFTIPKTNVLTRKNAVIELNPVTGAAWQLGDFDDFELGLISL